MAKVKRNVSARLELENYDKLKAIAENEGRSISNKISLILKDYIKNRYMPRKKK